MHLFLKLGKNNYAILEHLLYVLCIPILQKNKH